MSKGQEALKEHIINLKSLGFTRCEEWLDLIVIEKELKALEIIKDKKVNVSALLELDDLQQYNDYCNMVGGCEKLGYEYDLLKEVLL